MQIPTGLSMMRRAAAGPATIAWALGSEMDGRVEHLTDSIYGIGT